MRDSSKAVLQHSVVAALQLVFDIWQLHGSMPHHPQTPDLPSLPLLFFNLPVHTETTSALNHMGHAGKMWSPDVLQNLIINLLGWHEQQLNATRIVHSYLAMDS